MNIPGVSSLMSNTNITVPAPQNIVDIHASLFETVAKQNPVLFLKTHPDAVLPTRKHNHPANGDSGYDVTAIEDKVIPKRGASIVEVGLKLAYLPPNLWIRVESRSGLQFKHGIMAFPGIIDNMYRGDMGIRLLNFSDIDYEVKKGDRIAQFVLYPLAIVSTGWADEIQETERGEKGFGSSGK
jgi:dUTP pyrophosphatase